MVRRSCPALTEPAVARNCRSALSRLSHPRAHNNGLHVSAVRVGAALIVQGWLVVVRIKSGEAHR